MEKTIDYNRQVDNSLCPITDVMAALGLGFDEQLGPNRHYILADTRTGKVYDFEVNVIRDEWISRKDNVRGGLMELIEWLPDVGLNNLDSYTNWGISHVRRMYIELWHMQNQYPFTNLRYGKSAIASIGKIQDREVLKNLAWHGISMTTAITAGCKEALVFEQTKRKSSRMLAFPCEDGSYYLYNGACYRPINEGGISVIGKHRRDQFCYVYSNWHDCLAMMERCHRNHIGMLCEGARHLVINGEKNIGKAMEFLKENPDFREVRCLFPKDEVGDRMFLKVADATKGDATDCSYLYDGLPSMAAGIKHPIPDKTVELFKWLERRKFNKKYGINDTVEIRKKEQRKSDEPVKKPEIKVEPQGESQKYILESEKIIKKPKWSR